MSATPATSRAPSAPPSARASLLRRLASWSQRHRWTALLAWVIVVAAVTMGAQAVGSSYRNDFSLPGTQSQEAADLLEQHGAAAAANSVQVVFESPVGLQDPAIRAEIEAMLGRVEAQPGVAAVRSPYADAAAVSPSGTIGYATVLLDQKAEETPRDHVTALIDTAQAIEGDDLRVELGGDAVRAAQESEGGGAEGAGMLAAAVILVLLFGSLVAASLPLITAVFAVLGATGLIALASQALTVADFTPPIMMLVGLGVGVDYALLIFHRYRQELLRRPPRGDHPDPAGLARIRRTAAATAMDTAGRSVLFAGGTVIVSLLGLVALGLGSLQGVALAVALTVLVTMAASVTLLPALLALSGRRIQRHVLKRAARHPGRHEGRAWHALARAVQRRPLVALVPALVVLLALSAPAVGLRLGFADAGNDSSASTSRQAYDLLAQGFGPGFNGPLVVVTDHPGDGATLSTTLNDTDGIAATTPPIPSPDGAIATVIAFPAGAPQAASTTDLLERLRSDVLPGLAEESGGWVAVTGPTAAAADFADSVADRMPLFIAIVVGSSALLLLAVFRSVLIPVKAAVLNLLSISAALGVVTLVFQHGWFGVTPGPVEAFIPVMIFAIVFGLSMDYEVFLVSRMHEEWRRTGDAAAAVREGLATTGQVITAAAAIMIVVFAAFIASPSRMLQQFGLGLAVAVLLDAVVIRCAVVPAVMQLMGERAWWLPSWLDRRLPRVTLEGATDSDDAIVLGPAGDAGQRDGLDVEVARGP